MTSNLINRDDALAVAQYSEDKVEGIKNLPAADAVEVVHARWKLSCHNGVYEQGCTNCGFFPGIKFWSSNYCPNCGSRMDGE